MARLTETEKAQLLAATVKPAQAEAPPPTAARPALGPATYFAQLQSWQQHRPTPKKPADFSGTAWRL